MGLHRRQRRRLFGHRTLSCDSRSNNVADANSGTDYHDADAARTPTTMVGQINFALMAISGISGSATAGLGDDPSNAGQRLNTWLAKLLRIDVSSVDIHGATRHPFVGNRRLPGDGDQGLRNHGAGASIG